MRFLCLHGMGTNAEIFEFQLGSIRHALGDLDEFEFYEGEHEVPPADGIRNIFPYDSYKAWYSPHHGAHTHRTAIDDINDIIATEGPFDGCIGFSQGAALLASVLISYQTNHPFSSPPFHLAIFICGSSALSVNQETGQWSRFNSKVLEKEHRQIKIPTVHIYGKRDEMYQESLNLRDMCAPSMRVEFDHGAGHEIPRGVGITAQMVRVVRKGMERALSAH